MEIWNEDGVVHIVVFKSQLWGRVAKEYEAALMELIGYAGSGMLRITATDTNIFAVLRARPHAPTGQHSGWAEPDVLPVAEHEHPTTGRA